MYQIPELRIFDGLFHSFSTVRDGNMSLVIGGKKVALDEVIENRKRFFKKVGIDIKRAMTIWLTHGVEVVEAKGKWLGKTIFDQIDPPKADAVITNKPNTFLALTVADCVPVIIYDPKVKAVGLVHAGWKGVDRKIVVKTVHKLVEKYNSEPQDLVIGIGPCIAKDSYVKENFSEKEKKAWGNYVFDPGSGKCSIDMVGYIKKQLIDLGVQKSNIKLSGVDTFRDNNFYSHYRDMRTKEGDRGRFFCVVGITQ